MEQFGIELKLAVLFVLQTVGMSVFAAFDVETAAWRMIVKWLFIGGVTVGLYYWVGHWSLAFPLFMAVMGTTVHYVWCKKNGIHPTRCTPRRKYYEYKGWEWNE